MYLFDITGGPGIGRLVQSLTRYSRIGGNVCGRVVAFTIPVRITGGGSGWIWDGSSDKVHVQITGLERVEPADGRDDLSEDWRFTGVINSLYEGLDGTKVRGTYSVATRTGTLERVPDAQTAP